MSRDRVGKVAPTLRSGECRPASRDRRYVERAGSYFVDATLSRVSCHG